MNITTYEDGNQTTTLDIINACEWMQHEYREPVRKLIAYVMRNIHMSSMKVAISATYTTVTIPTGDDGDSMVITFRHWFNSYAGAMIDGVHAYALINKEWVNLN